MKKILLLAERFPYWYANPTCDEKIINSLKKTGKYEIHCLCYKTVGSSAYENYNSVAIHRFFPGILKSAVMWGNDNNKKISGRIINKFSLFLLRIEQILFIPFYPSNEPFLARKFARKAVKLNKIENFDYILAEHNGYNSLYAGYMLKEKFPRLKFIAVLWDPFTGKELAKYLPESYSKKRYIKDENKLLHKCDKIIAMNSSKSYHEKNSVNKSYYEKYVFLDIPGIIENKSRNQDKDFVKNGFINILYSGLLTYPDRDPEYIVNLLNKSKFSNNINLIFLSKGSPVNKLKILKESFNGNIIINDYVDREKLMGIMNSSDLLLNMGGSNPYMVPSKIFEYMSLGKPVLSTYFIENDSSKSYFDKYPLALCIDIRKPVESNLDVLNEFLDSKIGQKAAFDDVKNCFPKCTPEAYCSVIESL